MTRSLLAVAVIAVLIAPAAATAAHHEADEKSRLERAGTCEDARSQMEYFCNPANTEKDSMVAIGTACTNAKNNVKAACEGIDTPDPEYKFDR